MTPLSAITLALTCAALGALAVLQWQAWQRGAWRRSWRRMLERQGVAL